MQNYALKALWYCCHIFTHYHHQWFVVCDWHVLYVQNSNGETSLTHTEIWVPLFLYCCFTTPCWISSCWQTCLARAFSLSGTLSCPQCRLPLTCSRCHQGLLLIHQFPGIVASWHHSISCMSFLLVILALLCISWYILFNIHPTWTDFSLQNDLHTPAVIGENLLG